VSDTSQLGVSIDPFSVTVRRFCEDQAPDVSDKIYRAIVTDFLARVKERTPVRTGYLRASWTVVTAQSAAGVTGGDGGIGDLHYGDGCLIVNPAVYARRVEFGFVGTDSLGRHYNEKGRGMLTQTVNELPQIAAQAAARVLGGSTI